MLYGAKHMDEVRGLPFDEDVFRSAPCYEREGMVDLCDISLSVNISMQSYATGVRVPLQESRSGSVHIFVSITHHHAQTIIELTFDILKVRLVQEGRVSESTCIDPAVTTIAEVAHAIWGLTRN